MNFPSIVSLWRGALGLDNETRGAVCVSEQLGMVGRDSELGEESNLNVLGTASLVRQ